MQTDLSVAVAGLRLKNPVIAGSGEATMTLDGIRAALDAGAGAVVAKSTNESAAAKRQLSAAEYALLDVDWRPLPFGDGRGEPTPRGASLFCRSGLVAAAFDEWIEVLARADAYARGLDAYVVGSLIVSDPAESARMAKEMERIGLRWLELNAGAPHAAEAAAGAIRAAGDPAGVAELVRPVREAVSIPLTVKLAGGGDPLPGAQAAVEAGADAVCLAGRTMGFLPDLETRRPVLGTFAAIGGSWALPLTLHAVAKARQRLGPELSLIGTNGARDGRDVARFLLAGASAVEMTTSVITDGPRAITRAVAGFSAYLEEQGTTAAAIVGEAADHVKTYADAEDERGAWA